ncbi:MAG: NAD(P)/FAD-dependent oxidoreductase [archaeon]
MNEYDVMVVGASAGGSTCARLLGEKGLRVLLVDQATFPHPRGGHDLILEGDLSVLGDSFRERVERKNPLSLGGLSLVGDSLEGGSPSPAFKGIGVSRSGVDTLLFEQASKGVDFREKTQAVGLVRKEGLVAGVRLANLSTKEVKEVTSDVIIGADGPFSMVAEWSGLETHNPHHAWVSVQTLAAFSDPIDSIVRVHPLLAHAPAYAWMIPQSADSMSVGLSFPLSRVRSLHMDIAHELSSFLAHPYFVQRNISSSEFVHSSMRIHPSPVARSRANVLLLGHAAGLGGPFLGESFSNELRSAQIASDVIFHASENGFDPAILAEYSDRCSLELGARLQDSKNILRWMGYPSLLQRGIQRVDHGTNGHSFPGLWHCKETRKDLANPIQFLRVAAWA